MKRLGKLLVITINLHYCTNNYYKSVIVTLIQEKFTSFIFVLIRNSIKFIRIILDSFDQSGIDLLSIPISIVLVGFNINKVCILQFNVLSRKMIMVNKADVGSIIISS